MKKDGRKAMHARILDFMIRTVFGDLCWEVTVHESPKALRCVRAVRSGILGRKRIRLNLSNLI